MIGRAVGFGFATARDAVARVLVKLGVSPNMLTLTGMAITAGAGACYAAGAGSRFGWSLDAHADANAWLLVALGLLILSSACDMLDGAVARLGGKATRFGAFLDSTLDRYSDFAVYAGLAVHFAAARPANVTFVLLCMVAFFNAFMISYTRARAEDLIDSCKAGFWHRGERSAAILIATFGHNIPALVVQQALLPLLTVLRRIGYTRARINGRDPHADARKGPWWVRVQIWRWPRATAPYDLTCLLAILWLLAVRLPPADVLRDWLMHSGG